MKKRKMFVIMMSAILLLGGCSSQKSSNSTSEMDMSANSNAMEENMNDATADMVSPESAISQEQINGNTEEALTSTNEIEGSNNIKKQQKLIKNMSLNVETKEFDALLEKLNKKITEMNGYIESSEINGESYQYESTRWASLTIRIPCDSLNEFVTVVDEASNITNKTENTEDVTLQYVDMSSHVAALRAEQKSLMKILSAATKLEDIITIQSQLTQVRYEIESYESQLRAYDNLVDYSTITILINEVMRETIVKPGTFGEKISERFSNNLYKIGQSIENFLIWFISSIPYLIIGGVIIACVTFICLKITKKRKIHNWEKRNLEKTEEKDVNK